MTEKQQAFHNWLTFLAAPLATLGNVSLCFYTLNAVAGGLCKVERGELAEKQPVSAPNRLENIFAAGTRVSALKVTAATSGPTYWFPYVMSGVGECEIDHAAPVGTVALTAGMNGCSLRIYQHAATGRLKFCHDNNGDYVVDATFTTAGYRHLLSINADAKTRGLPAENINNYWHVDFRTHAYSGVFFISMKSGASEWKVYLSACMATFIPRVVPVRFPSTRGYTIFRNDYSGTQRHNRLITTLAIPAPVPPVPVVVVAPAPALAGVPVRPAAAVGPPALPPVYDPADGI